MFITGLYSVRGGRVIHLTERRSISALRSYQTAYREAAARPAGAGSFSSSMNDPMCLSWSSSLPPSLARGDLTRSISTTIPSHSFLSGKLAGSPDTAVASVVRTFLRSYRLNSLVPVLTYPINPKGSDYA